MEEYKEATEFKKAFNESEYRYSDEFLFDQIQTLKNEIYTLKQKIEGDGK